MADIALVLNARIGKTLPRPLAQPPGAAMRTDARASLPQRVRRVPVALVLLFALALALWPHWSWMAQRLTDGSDEPWGLLALITVLGLIGREWRLLRVPPPAALIATATLALAAAVARVWLPPLAAAAVGMGAVATFLINGRRDRPATPIGALLLLALPVIASLQFYFGYPLRLVTAALAAPVLQAVGFAVEATGAALAYDGRLVLVDPPCAGIGMLWVGAYTAALLSYLGRASAGRTLVNGAVAAACVFFANVARNVALFFPEALDLGWPGWTHSFIGLIAFGVALLPIVLFAQMATRRRRNAWPQWPQRYHRRMGA